MTPVVADGPADGTGLTRRRLLAAAGAAAAAGLAGCEASIEDGGGIGLSSATLADLELVETNRETSPIEAATEPDGTEEPPAREYVGYRRGPARGQPTAVEAFAGTVNGTRGAGPAGLVTASDAGVEELTLPEAFFEPSASTGGSNESVDEPTGSIDGPVTLDGGHVRLVVPAGASRDGDVDPARVLALVPAAAIAEAAGTFMWPLYWSEQRLLSAGEFAPDDDWLTPRDDDGEPPMGRWIPDDLNEYDASPIEQVLVASNDRSLAEVFGRGGDELGGRPVEGDDDVDPEEVVLAVPADQFVPGGPIWNWDDGSVFLWDEIYWSVGPAPLGGATFGLGAFVLPPDRDGEIGWATGGRAPIGEELQSETGREAVAEFVLGAGGSTFWHDAPTADDGTVFWHDAPTADDGSTFWSDAPTMDEPVTRITYDLSDELSGDGELRTFLASVDTDLGREMVAVHAGWLPPLEAGDGDVDEYVRVVGGQRAPVGGSPAEGVPRLDEAIASSWSDWIGAGSDLTAAVVTRLELE